MNPDNGAALSPRKTVLRALARPAGIRQRRGTPMRSPFRDLPELRPATAFARQAGMYALLFGLIAAAALLLRGALPALHFAPRLADFGLGLAGIVAYTAYNAAFPALLSASAPGRALLTLLAQRNQTLFGKLPLWTLLPMAVLAGVCEEVLFRGWLQPLAGLWLASFLFALVHFPPNRYAWSHPATWAMVALYFPVGLALGWLYLWRDNLMAPMVAHALSDSLGLFALSRARR